MTNPNRALTFRWTGIIISVIILIWLSIEDQNIVFLMLISVSWCVLGVARWFYYLDLPTNRWRVLLLGAGGGALVIPMAFVLILVKAGLHKHGFLDFTSRQITIIVQTVPVWVALGIIYSMFWLKSHPEKINR